MPADSLSRMEANNSGNDSNTRENFLSSSPTTSSLRERTDSENSEKMTKFLLPSMDGSPPKVLTLNEVAHVVENIKNMELAHEIALNPDFKLQPYEPPQESLEYRIKEIMHKAFWDVLRDQLKQTPPCFDNAIQLLADIKDCFPQILSRNNQRALEHINEVLDETVIRQQAEQGVLDFKSYANFVIQIMAKSCAPARDEAVHKLTQIDDVVDTFQGILETMTLMKLDMANFLLDFARNDIMTNSVEYEKEKFKEYLEYYKFGFPNTESWLKRHFNTQTQNNIDQAISNAYMELIAWDENNEFPEVLSMDKERLLKLGQRAKRLCIAASLISICCAMPIISQRSENRIELAKQIEILLQDVTNQKEITQAVSNVWEHIKISINNFLEKNGNPVMLENAENVLKNQILQIANKDAQVRVLMWKRLQTYIRLALLSKAGLPPPPPGYGDYKDELEAYAMLFKRVIAYNHSVFGDYFVQILTSQHQVTDSSDGAASTSTEKGSEALDKQ